jgi:hypothetical protein
MSLSTLKRRVPKEWREQVKSASRAWGTSTAWARPLPDFVIIGTKRGGTTSLWNWLLRHPSVLPMWPSTQQLKSPHYFYWHYANGPSWYRGFFPTQATRATASMRRHGPVVSGEASPYYLFDPRVPARVASHMPEVKIIVLLRDPVERAYSHFRERTNAGVETETFERALELEESRLAGEPERMQADPFYYSRPHDWYSYRSRGVYVPQLEAWKHVTAPEQMLIVRSEDMYDRPAQTYREVTDFLGVRPYELSHPKRHNYHPAQDMPPAVRAELTQYFAPHNQQLYDLVGRDMGWAR